MVGPRERDYHIAGPGVEDGAAARGEGEGGEAEYMMVRIEEAGN